MNLKAKLAEIKNKIKENPDFYIPTAIILATGTASAIATVVTIKMSITNESALVALTNKETVRIAKEEDRPIMFRQIDDKWFFKNQDPID